MKLVEKAREKLYRYVNVIMVAIVSGFHLFPFRTEKLSPSAPMVLQTRGRVGRRQLFKMKERAFVRTNARSCYDVLSAKLLFMNATHNLRIQRN